MAKISVVREIFCASSVLAIYVLSLYLVVVGTQHVWSGNYGLVDIGAIVLGAIPIIYYAKLMRSVPT